MISVAVMISSVLYYYLEVNDVIYSLEGQDLKVSSRRFTIVLTSVVLQPHLVTCRIIGINSNFYIVFTLACFVETEKF